MSRALAAFHLDRLAAAGLLEVEYRRLTGRTGRGAGRPAKLYRRASRDIAVSLPDRRYEALAGLLATALEAGEQDGMAALHAEALAYGEALTGAVRAAPGSPLEVAERVLDRHGFEPAIVDGELVLRNCPFDAIARRHRDLVCTMNRSLIEGVLRGLGAGGVHARLQPRLGMCCVVVGEGVAPAASAAGRGGRGS